MLVHVCGYTARTVCCVLFETTHRYGLTSDGWFFQPNVHSAHTHTHTYTYLSIKQAINIDQFILHCGSHVGKATGVQHYSLRMYTVYVHSIYWPHFTPSSAHPPPPSNAHTHIHWAHTHAHECVRLGNGLSLCVAFQTRTVPLSLSLCVTWNLQVLWHDLVMYFPVKPTPPPSPTTFSATSLSLCHPPLRTPIYTHADTYAHSALKIGAMGTFCARPMLF